MTSQISKWVAGAVIVMSLGTALSSQAPAQPSPQAKPQPPESMLKVDVVLTRHRVDASGKSSPELEVAARNLERQEALFDKGLVNKQQMDSARAKVKELQGPPVSRLPYTLYALLGTGSGRSTSLRVGVDIPLEPSTTTSKEGVTTTRRDARSIGTSIDAHSASVAADGRYRLWLQIQDSSVVPADRSKDFTSPVPVIRTFSTGNNLILREGQPMVFSVGSDPISGETLMAEVTVTLVK